MDASTVRARLRAEGIGCTVHRDGTLTASVTKPREQSWVNWLWRRVQEIPGATPFHWSDRSAGDPYFAHAVVRFRLGPKPESGMVERGRAA